jgi:catechol 2,3-dioxygenase-like lactoylglutathione lyase family enzyme
MSEGGAVDSPGVAESRVAVCVRELAEALAFWRDGLGLELIRESKQPAERGGKPREVVQTPWGDRNLRVVTRQGVQLTLFAGDTEEER